MSLQPGSLILFSQLMLLLAIALYGLPTRETPGRHHPWIRLRYACTTALLAGILSGSLTISRGSFNLAFTTTILCLAIYLARQFLPLRYRAELELGAATLSATILWSLIAHHTLLPRWPLAFLPYTPGRRSAYAISAALLLFSIRGGTATVRGILARGGTMPPPSKADPDSASHFHVPQRDLNHGRMIGDVERLILAILVANGQFSAIAFFFAGKGLIRSKELEARAWADYLLLGSLSSFLVTLVVGLLIQQVMLWQ